MVAGRYGDAGSRRHRQHGRHPHHLLPGSHQIPLQASRHLPAIFNAPQQLVTELGAGPTQPSLCPLLFAGIHRDEGMGGFMGINSNDDHRTPSMLSCDKAFQRFAHLVLAASRNSQPAGGTNRMSQTPGVRTPRHAAGMSRASDACADHPVPSHPKGHPNYEPARGRQES